MNKTLLAGLATTALVTAGFAGAAEARCFRTGHHLTCTHHHRMHYSHRPYYRTWAAGYGYPVRRWRKRGGSTRTRSSHAPIFVARPATVLTGSAWTRSSRTARWRSTSLSRRPPCALTCRLSFRTITPRRPGERRAGAPWSRARSTGASSATTSGISERRFRSSPCSG